MEDEERDALLAFLESLVIFPPDDTASTGSGGTRRRQFSPTRSWQHQAHGVV